MKTRNLALALLALTSGVVAHPTASAAVYIADETPAIVQNTIQVEPMNWVIVEIGRFRPGQKIQVDLQFSGGMGDLTAVVTDEPNLNFIKQKLPARGEQVVKGNSPIQIQATAWSISRYYLILDNRHSVFGARTVSSSVRYMEKTPAELKSALESMFSETYKALKAEYVFPDFDIHVQSCGQPNAFSSPDITFCTELLDDIVREQNSKLLLAILMHELGHSLLNLWGMPGYDNEDVADEFAAVSLLTNDKDDKGAEAVSEMVTWLSKSDSKAQAAQILLSGGRHAPSIQRIRNLQRLMEDPAPAIARWNRFLYPHMTEAALSRISGAPDRHDNAELAKQALALRQSAVAAAVPPGQGADAK